MFGRRERSEPPASSRLPVVLAGTEPEPKALAGAVAGLSLVVLFATVALSRRGVLPDGAATIALGVWLILTAIALPVMLGAARGPLRALARPPWEVGLDAKGVSWRRGSAAGGTARWANVGGVDAIRTRYGSWTVIRDMAGGETVKLFGTGFLDARTGWKGSLADAVVAARRDRYELMPHGRFDGSRSAVIRLTGDREPHGAPPAAA